MTKLKEAPLLYVDVNLGENKAERIIVYEGNRAEDLSKEFAIKHCKYFE